MQKELIGCFENTTVVSISAENPSHSYTQTCKKRVEMTGLKTRLHVNTCPATTTQQQLPYRPMNYNMHRSFAAEHDVTPLRLQISPAPCTKQIKHTFMFHIQKLSADKNQSKVKE